MNDWKTAARQALISGTAASVLSTVALAVAGKVENRSAAGPLNGPSQWLFGRQAAHRKRATLRHTLTGLLIHHASAMGWALLHERLFGRRKAVQSPMQRVGQALATTAVANFVDFKLTPRRLQPGFDAQLSRKSIAMVYGAFALGLSLYALSSASRRRR